MRKVVILAALVLIPVIASAGGPVDIYAKQLRSRDANERAEAAEGLGRLGTAEAVPLLITALSDKDARVRRAAASGLWDASEVAQPAIPALRNALNDPDPAVIVRAAGALINMDVEPKEIAEPLRIALRTGDSIDKFLAARALIGIDPGEKLAGPLLDYARANAPQSKGDTSAFFARKDNFEMAAKALKQLAGEQQRAVIPIYTAALREPQLAEPVLYALGEFKPRPEGWVTTLLGQVESRDPRVRAAAAELLGKQNSAAADVSQWAAPLGRLMSDADASVRQRALWSLEHAGGLAHDGLDGVLQAVSKERDADIRERAAQAAGEIANQSFAIGSDVKKAMAQRALPVLTATLANDPEPRVRRAAVGSLNKLQLDGSVILPVLAGAAVNDKDLQVRMAALQDLRNRGKDAAPVADKIRPLVQDSDPSIRRDAQAALDAMKSDYRPGTQVKQTAAVDPAARERGLAALREKKLEFTEGDFYRALMERDLEQITAFLDAGMSPNLRFTNSYGDPVLRVAVGGAECGADVKPVVKFLLSRGSDPKIADDRGNTPLMEAAQKCDASIVKMLLAAGANMNAKNISGMTAFEFGLFNANPAVDPLIAAGFRLSPEKLKMYREAYKNKPKILAIVNKAAK